MDGPGAFYDDLAADYHLLFADWDASVARQGEALDAVVRAALGTGPAAVLDCACGIGTQALGLALAGHRVVGTDLSPRAAARARREAAARGAVLPTGAADMRSLPFRDATFDVVVCADNALPHLLTPAAVGAALGEVRRVLRPGGLLVASVRDYDRLRETRPAATAPQVHGTGDDRVVTVQVWDWHADGERYDLQHLQLFRSGGGWRVVARETAYWAVTRRELTGLIVGSGFGRPAWMPPERSGFFQPLVAARAR